MPREKLMNEIINPHADENFFAHVKDPRHVLFEATLHRPNHKRGQAGRVGSVCTGRGQPASEPRTTPTDPFVPTPRDEEAMESFHALLLELPDQATPWIVDGHHIYLEQIGNLMLVYVDTKEQRFEVPAAEVLAEPEARVRRLLQEEKLTCA